MKEISLTQGKVAIVDDDMYESLIVHNWYAQRDKTKKIFYACSGNRPKNLVMHRLVINAQSGISVDHINGNPLDNRVCNLRLVTQRQNMQNMHNPRSSQYPGVHLHKADSKWYSHIYIEGKRVCLGFYLSEQEAFKAYLNSCVSNGFPIDFLVKKFGIVPGPVKDCRKRKISIYPGVYWHKATGKWKAALKFDKKYVYLGLFMDEKDAFDAYISERKSRGLPLEKVMEKLDRIKKSRVESLLDQPMTDRERYLEFHETLDDLGGLY